MYRLDHFALRTLNKKACINFLVGALGYRVADEFPIYFNDEKTDVAMCSVLEPGNRLAKANMPWTIMYPFTTDAGREDQRYVLEPEIFVSEGTKGSIVYEWAAKRGGASLHHMALQVPEYSTIEKEVKKWRDNGWAEDGFSTEEPIVCPELKQIFTKPSSVTGIIFELIERKTVGFCRSSVRELMLSTKGD